jgi:hypothetical protein
LSQLTHHHNRVLLLGSEVKVSVCGIVVASCHNKAQQLEQQLELLLPAGLLAKIPFAS